MHEVTGVIAHLHTKTYVLQAMTLTYFHIFFEALCENHKLKDVVLMYDDHRNNVLRNDTVSRCGKGLY